MLSADVAARFIALGKLTAVGTDTLIGSKAVVPDGAGPYTVIVDTGGPNPLSTHDDWEFRRPQCQVSVRARLASDARSKIMELRNAVGAGWYNVTIGSTFYEQIVVQGEVMDLQQDGKGRPKFGFNLTTVHE